MKHSKHIVKIIIGFAILILILLISWIIRDMLISTFVIPLILGVVQFGRLINTLPQILWWILIILFSLTLFFIKIDLPSIGINRKKNHISHRGRIEFFNSLLKETLNGSKYSGQTLSLLLVNLYLRNKGESEINIHKLEDLIYRDKIPSEISDFVKIQLNQKKRLKNTPVIRLSLERAVQYLNNAIKGELTHDRSSE